MSRKPTMCVDDTDRYVGRRIREERRSRDISLESLAAVAEFSYQHIGRIEKGTQRIHAGQLYLIARALGLPVREFFPPVDEYTGDLQVPFVEAIRRMPNDQVIQLSGLVRTVERGSA